MSDSDESSPFADELVSKRLKAKVRRKASKGRERDAAIDLTFDSDDDIGAMALDEHLSAPLTHKSSFSSSSSSSSSSLMAKAAEKVPVYHPVNQIHTNPNPNPNPNPPPPSAAFFCV